MSSRIRYNVIFLNNILNVLDITLEPFVEIQWVYAEIRQMMGIEQINTIEIFKIDDTARISIPSYINIPDDAKPAKVLEFLNSATILRPPHFYFDAHQLGESCLAVHLIVDYPRDICISYAAYIVGRLHHTSSIVLSNKVDVSTLRRLIAKDLERKEDLLQLYSAWDDILTNTDDNKLRAATLTVEGRIPLLGHTILSEILPLKIKRHIDVIVSIEPQPNLGDIPAMPTATEELLQLLEEQEFTRREHEEANRRLVEKVGQLRGLVVREKAERRHEEEQRAQVQDERQQSSQEGLAILMKQDKLEMWREAEEIAKAVQGSKKDVEGESCEPRKASDSTDFLKAMVDEQRRQTDLLTGMLAEQRQNAEWARQHGQNVEKLLQQLIRKAY